MNELQGVDRFISFVSAWHEDICVQWLKLLLVSKWSETGESKKSRSNHLFLSVLPHY